MHSGWVFLGIALLFVAFAMALVLRPLFRRTSAPVRAGRRSINIAVYRDQLKEMEADRVNGLLTDTQFETARLELEARLAQDAVGVEDTAPVSKGARKLGATLAVLIPVAAFGLYFMFGNVRALNESPSGQLTMPDIQSMLQSAEAKVKSNPDDAQTWAMLARAYTVMDRYPDAVRAFENLARLTPDDASVWSHYGEALALANGRTLDGKPMEMIRKALTIDPKDVKGLELSGIYAYQHKDYKTAIQYWQDVIALSPPGEQYTRDMQAALEQAKQMASEPAARKLDNLSDFSGAAAGAGVSGTVSITAKLKGRVAAGDTVFVYARDGQAGGGQPLAAVRLEAGSLPAPFDLTDAQAMTPDNAISKHASVTLIARISKTGNAMPQPGDLEGELQAVKIGSKGLKLVIDRVRP